MSLNTQRKKLTKAMPDYDQVFEVLIDYHLIEGCDGLVIGRNFDL